MKSGIRCSRMPGGASTMHFWCPPRRSPNEHCTCTLLHQFSSLARQEGLVQSVGFFISWLLYQSVSLSVGSLVVFAVIYNVFVWSIVQRTSQLNGLLTETKHIGPKQLARNKNVRVNSQSRTISIYTQWMGNVNNWSSGHSVWDVSRIQCHIVFKLHC